MSGFVVGRWDRPVDHEPWVVVLMMWQPVCRMWLVLVDRLARSVIVPKGGSRETDFETRWGQFSVPSSGAPGQGVAPLSLGVQRSHTLCDCPYPGTPICVQHTLCHDLMDRLMGTIVPNATPFHPRASRRTSSRGSSRGGRWHARPWTRSPRRPPSRRGRGDRGVAAKNATTHRNTWPPIIVDTRTTANSPDRSRVDWHSPPSHRSREPEQPKRENA